MAALSPASAAAIARLRAFTAAPTNYYSLPLKRRAAVLILLYADRKGDLRVVLTIRSANLKNYSGQAALPGGKADTLTESPFQTARREAYEEIGLPLSDDKLPPGYSVEHVAELPSNLAMTELGVRPCVAYLKTLPASEATSGSHGTEAKPADPARDLLPKLDAKEVAAVFTAPFHNFLREADEDPESRTSVPGQWYKGSWHQWHEEPWRMHQFFVPVSRGSVFKGHQSEPQGPKTQPSSPTDEANSPSTLKARTTKSGLIPPLPASTYQAPPDALAQPRYRVFGMTARILVDAARVAYGEEPNFEHNSHFGDEDMIRRLMRIGRLSPIKKEGEWLSRDVMVKAAKI